MRQELEFTQQNHCFPVFNMIKWDNNEIIGSQLLIHPEEGDPKKGNDVVY